MWRWLVNPFRKKKDEAKEKHRQEVEEEFSKTHTQSITLSDDIKRLIEREMAKAGNGK